MFDVPQKLLVLTFRYNHTCGRGGITFLTLKLVLSNFQCLCSLVEIRNTTDICLQQLRNGKWLSRLLSLNRWVATNPLGFSIYKAAMLVPHTIEVTRFCGSSSKMTAMMSRAHHL